MHIHSAETFINHKFILPNMAIPTDSQRATSDRMRLNISVNEARRPEIRPEPRSEPFRLQSSPEADPFRETTETRERRPDREIHLSIKPWKLFKFFMVLVLLSGLFFTGRWSAAGTEGMFGFSDSAPTAAVVTEKVTAPPPVVEKAAEPTKEAVTAAVTTPIAEVPKTGTSEAIITKYSKVALATSSVKLEWHETWGKIMQLVLTIKNNEAGTIKPSYLIMNVEGYDDFDKRIDLPKTIQTIKSGEKIEGTVNVLNGFAYNKVTTGELGTVRVIVKMYDDKDTVITSYEREFNLDGSVQ